MTLDELVSSGEAMLKALGLEYYRAGAGLEREPSFQAIYDRHAVLQSDEALAAARASGSRELLEWIIGVRVGRAVAPFEEEQLRWEQGAMLRVNGVEVPYLDAPIRLANSEDRAYRTALDAVRARTAAAHLNGLRRDRFLREHQELVALGYPAYVEGVATLAGIDLDELGIEAAGFLDASAGLYDDSLARLVKRRLGVPVRDLVRADAPWAFRADRYDAAFPPDRLIALASRQMQEMGLDAAQSGRVRFDTDEREGKQPRAFCSPVRVPDEVYLVLRPRGGHADYRTFWHELGHAMHFASASRDLPFAARWLGDNSVTEAYAMLWDHLTLKPAWLRRYTAISREDTGNLTFEVAVNELYMVRRYAAKLLYELALHRSEFVGMGAGYADGLSKATGFRYGEEDHLTDVDPAFYSARYLRAWQLEAMLDATLTQRFDDEWFRNPAAGTFVQDLMARGQADPAHALALEITQQPLGFEPIIRRLEPILS